MEKPKFLTIHAPEPPTEPSAAEQIAAMFATMEEVSFARDIAPVLFKEFSYQALTMRLCAAASETVERAIDIARMNGHAVKCVPQFEPRINGTLEVCDIVYKPIGWV